MVIHVMHLDPTVLGLFMVGIITLFGKKKKEEKEGEAKSPQSSTPPSPTPLGSASTTGSNAGLSAVPTDGTEETPLSKILRSLMQDLPSTYPSEKDDNHGIPFSTPDWVPPRSTPPSRLMTIVPGDKGGTPVENEEKEAAKAIKPPEPLGSLPKNIVGPPAFTRVPETEAVPSDTKKESKLDAGKQEVEKRIPAKEKMSFEHVFELTKDALRSPGLVFIAGPTGSGKTTFCSNLARARLDQGSPCIFVAYDQSPGTLREKMKKTGCDPSGFESQFRLVVVDGFSAQSESFSLEPYYIEKPFDLDNVQETLVRSASIFLGEKILVVLDSLDSVVSKIASSEFLKKIRGIGDRMRESGATLVATFDSGKLAKDVSAPLEEMADCVIAMEKEGSEGGRLKVRKLNGAGVKSEALPFEIDSGKGLVFS